MKAIWQILLFAVFARDLQPLLGPEFIDLSPRYGDRSDGRSRSRSNGDSRE